MKALIDTCIIIDALQARVPFAENAQKIFLGAATRKFDGFLTAKSMTDIYYLTHRLTHSNADTREILSKLCTIFSVVDTAATDIQNALLGSTSDFEDAVMIETAIRLGMDCIITRNASDYKESSVPVYLPSDFLDTLSI